MIFPKFKDCQLCRLCSHRTQIVWGTGNEKADLFLVGEAPGETEDSTGLPFQGKAGQKLDRILNYVGLDRSKVYISNSLLCRPPNNRPPNIDEIEACRPRLLEEISLVKPKLIVCLGRTAFLALSGQKEVKRVSDLFSDKPHQTTIVNEIYDYIVTYHPSYHIRNPAKAREITLPHWNLVHESLYK